ncbi:hypothetical protein TEA_004401 [Camellia sinensis var. sinensis]|uniref:Uncharacterized protein n=1 Tax=Camellia sinensis var. sinensis TaxID=542762 RepID=A0A4V3WNE6_CAMSN|nr:hypothetical protein TEA_004401 [Camellia sinensis var. sinensis]
MIVLIWADILAGYAMLVMMTYLTNVWKINLTHAAGIINIWGDQCLEDQFDARCWNYKHLGRHSFHNAARLCLPSRYVHGTLCNAPVLQHRLLYSIILANKTLEEQEKTRWRLCRVTEVEETKIGIRIIPMWLPFIACGIITSIGNTFFLEQANHMNRKLGRLNLPLPILLMFYDFPKSQFAKLYFTLTKNRSKAGLKHYAPPIGIAASMTFAILTCITAASVET